MSTTVYVVFIDGDAHSVHLSETAATDAVMTRLRQSFTSAQIEAAEYTWDLMPWEITVATVTA